MARPELCVLLAYAKRLVRDQLLPSSLPGRPLPGRRPRRCTSRARSSSGSARTWPAHPLRREIIATIVVNDVINSMGITFVARMAAETGRRADEICRAFLIAREVSQARKHWDDVEALDQRGADRCRRPS